MQPAPESRQAHQPPSCPAAVPSTGWAWALLASGSNPLQLLKHLPTLVQKVVPGLHEQRPPMQASVLKSHALAQRPARSEGTSTFKPRRLCRHATCKRGVTLWMLVNISAVATQGHAPQLSESDCRFKQAF